MCYYCYYLFHHSLNWSFFLGISRVQTMHLEHQSLKSIILFIRQAPCEDSSRSHVLLILSLRLPQSSSFLYQAHQQPQGSPRFSYATFSVFLILGTCSCFSSPFPSERCFFLMEQSYQSVCRWNSLDL